MTEKDDKPPPALTGEAREAADRRHRDRRSGPPKVEARQLGGISHDDQGNAVWEWRVEVPRRRDDDPTIDLLECLDVDGLSLEDDDKAEEPDTKSFNPYDRGR